MNYKSLITLSYACLTLIIIINTASAESISALGVKRINIENKMGSIDISKSSTNRIELSEKKGKFEKWCNIYQKVVKRTLYIKVEDSSFTGNGKCEVFWKLSVPKKLDIKIDQGSGNIKIEKDVKSLTISLGAGDLVVIGSAKKTIINIGTGEVQFTIAKPLKSSKYKIQTGSGSSVFKISDSVRVKSTLLTPYGKHKTEFTQSKKPHIFINMSSGKGSLNILKN